MELSRQVAMKPAYTPYITTITCIALALLGLLSLPATAQNAGHARPGKKIADVSRPSALSADELPPKLRGPVGAATTKLDEIANQAEASEGAMFVDEDKVQVKAPLLTALIELHRNVSPYSLDALGQNRPVSLRDVLNQLMLNNLNIQISRTNAQAAHYQYKSILGGFLPNVSNQLTYQGITGKYASPFGALTNIGSPYLTIPSGMVWNFFDGGTTIFSAKQAKHTYLAHNYDVQRTVNDELLYAARLYYQLVLQDVLLQIRIKAVETSEALYQKNAIQYKYGANTQLDLLQAETQLADDKQKLISQQIARRKAAIKLATTLNANLDEDLIISDRLVSPNRLIDDDTKVTDLVQIAIDNRPELKKWEQQRLAAKAAIKLAYSPLLPTISGTGALATTGAKVVPISAAQASSSVATGGLAAGGFSTTAETSTANGGNRPRKFSLAEIFTIGLAVQWNVGGLGYTAANNIKAARMEARKTQLEFARELQWVCRDVRDSYLSSIEAKNLIAATTAAVNSSRQQLKVAVIRLDEGVGTDLDVVNAQRSYTNALIEKANAIVQFNEAQVDLLKAVGKISVDTLTSPKALVR
ncbi:MAG: TolC family protein [Cyanobacteria bacterium SZAS LIN-5]|nr:TolC family protein [Cyanobacteria bacterium SZAS LIN-5]